MCWGNNIHVFTFRADLTSLHLSPGISARLTKSCKEQQFMNVIGRWEQELTYKQMYSCTLTKSVFYSQADDARWGLEQGWKELWQSSIFSTFLPVLYFSGNLTVQFTAEDRSEAYLLISWSWLKTFGGHFFLSLRDLKIDWTDEKARSTGRELYPWENSQQQKKVDIFERFDNSQNQSIIFYCLPHRRPLNCTLNKTGSSPSVTGLLFSTNVSHGLLFIAPCLNRPLWQTDKNTSRGQTSDRITYCASLCRPTAIKQTYIYAAVAEQPPPSLHPRPPHHPLSNSNLSLSCHWPGWTSNGSRLSCCPVTYGPKAW